MALIAMRISMPDRKGMLASVASEISAADAGIVAIEVIHREGGLVVDNVCIDTGEMSPSEVRRRVERVPHVVVEVVRAVDVPPSPVAALELAADLLACDSGRLEMLVARLPAALGTDWAMALELDDDDAVRLVHASARAPSPPSGTVPWMPLEGPRRLAVAPWMPTSWRLRSVVGGLEIAACPLDGSRRAVAAARTSGRFRPPELRQLEILAGLAMRADDVAVAATAPATL